MAPHRVVRAAEIGAGVPMGFVRPASALAIAVLAAVWRDPFTWAWLILVAFSIIDYTLGVAAATGTPAYNASRRARGRLAKIITALLMLCGRAVEAWAATYGVLDSSAVLRWAGVPADGNVGIISAFITMLAAIDEMGSIYGHRLAAGGSRLLLLELFFNGLAAVQRKLLGKAAKQTAEWAEDDPGDTFVRQVDALGLADQMVYGATHGGAKVPRRRAYDLIVPDAERIAGGPPRPAAGEDE